MRVQLLDTAKCDLRDGFRFYESQAKGLGHYFLDSAQAEIRSLAWFAGVHQKEHEFHRMLLKRFPFAVYYLVNDTKVEVYAVLDCRRDPVWISERLRISEGKES